MKKFGLGVLLSLCFCLTLFCVTAMAAPNDWTYDAGKLTNEDGVVINNVSASDTELTIGDNRNRTDLVTLDFSGTISDESDTYTITSIGSQAFEDCTALESATLPAATTIGEWAFEGCTALNSITLPEATTIGEWAFGGCTALSSITLPEATTIENQAFQECAALNSIDLPEATTIGNEAFLGCTALESVTLPKATTIGNEAFAYCSALKSITLPEATTIGDLVFYSCTTLESITLPKATTIGNSAFVGCSGLTGITLPKATTIGNKAFESCAALTSLYFEGNCPTWGWSVFADTPNYTIYYNPDTTGWTATGVPDSIEPYAVFESVTANGTSLTTSTTELTLTFNTPVTGLALTDLGITGATATSLTDNADGTYTLAVTLDSDLEEGDTLSVTREGFNSYPFTQTTTAKVRVEYGVNVTGGTATPISAAQGESVTVTADTSVDFVNWSGADSLTITSGDIDTDSFTFTMPAEEVNLTANYLNLYAVTAGANSSWQLGGTDSLSFTSLGDFNEFLSAEVDGNPLTDSDYTVASGSTIMTLKASYLNTLAAGTHTLYICFTDGYSETTFTVTPAAESKPESTDSSTTESAVTSSTSTITSTGTRTGDSSLLSIGLFCMLVALGGVSAILRTKHKNR